jgi:energy-coupling factor transporter ATP-binding protein EcfA2
MKEKKQNIRIEKISIRNYRGIEKLDLDFNLPQMPEDPDITILGSKNGVGKTSVLECCAWLILGTKWQPTKPYKIISLVQAGYEKAKISGNLINQNISDSVDLEISCKGNIKIENFGSRPKSNGFDLANLVELFTGRTINPLITDKFLFFHSYRKVQEGFVKLGTMLTSENSKSYRNPISNIKELILKSLMSSANLFEQSPAFSYEEIKQTIEVLDNLLATYTETKIGKLGSFADNTIDIKVESLTTGKTYSFDGLSSGQKEIISTLFMIWSNTRDNPAVVLIDEPELHLNVEWHKNFIKKLVELAPKNQYIIATHSEDIMASVDKSRRILLTE